MYNEITSKYRKHVFATWSLSRCSRGLLGGILPAVNGTVVSICYLQRRALYWFHTPGLQLHGHRSFAFNEPATWNRLPPALRSPDLSESAFKRALNTHLFSTAWRHWDVFMILALDIHIQTYLLTITTVCLKKPDHYD